MTITDTPRSTEAAALARTKLLDAVRGARPALAQGGFESDRDNAYPLSNKDLLGQIGAQRVLVPARFGGLWEGGLFGAWEDIIRIATEIAAGDGSTGQNYAVTAVVARELFDEANGLPEDTLRDIARRMLEENLQIVASNAETGISGKVIARPADGGVVLSGVKTFNSNSGAGGLANVGCQLEGREGRYHVLVDLSDPSVEFHHDWDNMGQRGTYSQTVTYHDVFVPDGWHYPAVAPNPSWMGALMLLHASHLQGIGEGALDAAVEYVRGLKRGTLPQFATAAEDPLVLRRIGEISSQLAASRALLFEAARQVEATDDGGDPDKATMDGYRTKVACVAAGLAAADMVHEVSGARSTSNRYRLDRFWRNARTFACHDSMDAKSVYVGAFEVTQKVPSVSSYLRI